MKTIVFCILRKALEENKEIQNQVNFPLYEYQQQLLDNPKNKKAFVYQYKKNKVMIEEPRSAFLKNMFYMDTKCEICDYTHCLLTASALAEQYQNKYPSAENFLIILMEQPISPEEANLFFKLHPEKPQYHLILMMSDDSKGNLQMKHYIQNQNGKVCYFKQNDFCLS